MSSLIVKYTFSGTLPLGLAGNGTKKFSALRLKILSTGREATPCESIIFDFDLPHYNK